eukprot:CAMPEP_0170479552 /NCGR_PEP_ID=MMETSP0208-20121228/749_1 /TAXON_ID=197538 /ORGANISM="Strombidium inclinatum, Strain S3" /LENGTH=48 /DNA_ID= /DNA_START= /DNA_END= /DNA_ORIENTATION=
MPHLTKSTEENSASSNLFSEKKVIETGLEEAEASTDKAPPKMVLTDSV